MALLFFILVVVGCIILGLFVLIQNPKGGGLSGTIAGFNNQFMGVKQTTDVLEKGTWLFAGLIGLLCLLSTLFFKGATGGSDSKLIQQINTNQTAPAPQQTAPQNAVPLNSAPDSGK